jgi:hypothetical protein
MLQPRSKRPDTGESNQTESSIDTVYVARRSRFAPIAHRFHIGSRSRTLPTFQYRTLPFFPLSLPLGQTRRGHIDALTRIALQLGDWNLRRR